MNAEEATFFREKLFPIIQETAQDQEPPNQERNPLRNMLRLLIGYVEYLESKAGKNEAPAGTSVS